MIGLDFTILFLNSVGVFETDEHIQVQDKGFFCKAVSAVLPHGLSAGVFSVAEDPDGNSPGHVPIHCETHLQRVVLL